MNWKLAAASAFIAVPAVALLGFGLTRDPGAIDSPLPGRDAPAFTLAAFTSGAPTVEHPAPVPRVDSVDLVAMRGDVVVLNFFASWCLACRDEHPALARAGSRYVGTDVHFVGVLYNDSPTAALRWLGELGALPYPSLSDPGSRVAIDYGLYGVPETFFIGRDGRVAYKHLGPVDESLLVAKVESLRALPRVSNSGAP
jgi:cytochrome c biogenesis protein CcmG/thiol:disulfide interchange protein DsbE